MTKPDAEWIVPVHGGGRLKPFQKGRSGNPGGARDGSAIYGQVIRMARRVSPEILDALAEIALDPETETRARIVACTAILDRAFGRPPDKPPQVDGDEAPTLDATKLTDRELKALLKLWDSGRLGDALRAAEGEEAGEVVDAARARKSLVPPFASSRT